MLSELEMPVKDAARAAYARVRIDRLTTKVEGLTERINSFGCRRLTDEEFEQCEEAIRQWRSSKQALKRWKNVLKGLGFDE